MKGPRTFVDASNRVWTITKESLPKKRGEYSFYRAESQDKSHREDQLKRLLAYLKNNYGKYEAKHSKKVSRTINPKALTEHPI